MKRICVIGNAGGGKTVLSRRLAEIYHLPVFHVDQIQFLPDLSIRPLDETRQVLQEWIAQEKWIIDGFGPLDLLEKRWQEADQVILIDLSLWRHLWWCTKRQIKNLWLQKRAELPEGSREFNWAHTRKLYQSVWEIHYKMRPELLRILSRDSLKHKVLLISNLKQWRNVFESSKSAGAN